MWWENEPLQSLSKSVEQTASPQKTAHMLVSQMKWHEPLDFRGGISSFPV